MEDRKHIEDIQEIVAQQSKNIDNILISTTHMAKAIEKRPTKLSAITFIAVGMSVLLIIISVMFWLVFQSNKEIHDTSQGNKRILELIEDCVHPEGSCARRGTEATSRAVLVLNEYNLMIAQCIADGADNVEACVTSSLQANQQP